MDIRTREAVRYLGYGRHAIDERTLQLVEDSFKELEHIVNAKFTYRIFETTFPDTNELSIGKMKIKSKNLYKNLKGCSQAVVFGATLDRCGCAYETIQSDGYGEGSCSAGVCSCDAGGIL